MMTRVYGLGLLLALMTTTAAAQEMQGPRLQPRWLIDAPTAGLLPRGSFNIDFRFYEQNGMLAQFEIGIFNQAMIGFSYGGQDIVGNLAAQWNPRVEFSARVRVIDEGLSSPAVAVGYQSQGHGSYDEALERYKAKSKGLYAVVSKNFGSAMGEFGIHGGVNRSLEDTDGDGDLSGFVGFDKALGRDISVVAEYDFALNDNEDNALGSGKGFLNLGGRWSLSRQLALEFDVKNIFQDGARNPYPDRELRILFFEEF